MYPFREDYTCPECKTGKMKWRSMEFHSTYVLGESFCDNPDCGNSYENRYRIIKLINKEVPKV